MKKEAKIEITCWRSSRVLFAHEAKDNTVLLTVEAAIKAGVSLAGANLVGENLAGSDLAGADLTGANLAWADLTGANLTGAILTEANLRGANLDGVDLVGAYLARADLAGAYLIRANLRGVDLRGANLDGADLAGAYLAGANLTGAYLRGAYLDGGEKLIGRRPILQIGPIGSDSRYLTAFLTDRGLRLRTGCFFGTREQFETDLADIHGDNTHAQEYRVALALIEAHERLWMPTDEMSDTTRATRQKD